MDEATTQKDKELEALILLAEETARWTDEQRANKNEYGSEDEEYDGLCTQLVSEVDGEDNITNGFQTESMDWAREMEISIG